MAPTDLDLPHQQVDTCAAGELALLGEMGVAQGGEDGLVAEDLLYFQQVNARFDQVALALPCASRHSYILYIMRGIAMAQAVWRNSFFKPQSWMTWCRAS